MSKYYHLLLLLSFLFFGAIQAQATDTDLARLFDKHQNHGEVYFRFQNQNLDIEKISHLISIDKASGNTWFYAYANSKQFLSLAEENMQIEMLQHPGTLFHPKMKSFVDVKNIQEWDFYPTYDAYVNMIYQFESLYPNLCRIEVIGQTQNGRDLLACVISDNAQLDPAEVQFLYTSSIHGDETTGYVLLLRLIDYLLSNYGTLSNITEMVDNMEIWINPLANPDGSYAGGNNSIFGATRYNANGVDMNRNYEDPRVGANPDGNEYQLETLAFMELAENNNFKMSANIHGGEEVCNYPWDTWQELHPKDEWWKYVCHQYADTAQFYSPPGYLDGFDDGITNGAEWYVITGGRQDYMNWFHDCLEFTLEISTTKLLPENQLENWWQYNYRSLINYMYQATLLGSHDEFELKPTIGVSPNPGNGIYHISYNAYESEIFTVNILNQSGSLMKTFKVNLGLNESNTIDIQSLDDGIYILNLINDKTNISRKIIKE